MRISTLWAALPMAVIAVSAAMAEPGPYHQPYGPACTPAGRHPRIESCEAAYWENSMWPRQYIGPSRRGICQANEAMINNGWRRHNLLGKYHFDAQSDQLTEAGQLKVEWILTQAPAHRRSIYVERTRKAEQTAGRVEAVQELAATMTPTGELADVQETHVRDEGHPALSVDAVFTGFHENRMIPALPQSAAGGSSSEEASQ